MANSKNEAKIKFTADTQEFTKNIGNAESSMKALRSELKLNQTQMAGVDDTTELLQERQNLLRKEIEASQQKIDALNGKLNKAKEILGEDSKEFNDLTVQINYAQNAQLKMQQELDSVNNKLQEQKNAANQSKTALQELTEKISSQEEKLRALREKYQNVVLEQGKNSSEAKSLRKEMSTLNDELVENKKTLNNAEEASKKYSSAIEDAGEKSEKASKGGFTVMKGALSQLIHDGINKVIEGLKSLGNKVVETAAKADDILTKSTVTGLSTDMLQELDYAADYIDTEVDTITGSMTKLNKNMTSSSKNVQAAFDTLKISVRDTNGQLRDDETVYWEVIDALGKVTNETERDNLAMQLLGKSAQDLNPLIEAGSGTMKKLADEAHNMGYVMDEDALSSLGKFDDMTHQIEDMGTSFIQDIVTSLMGMVDTQDVIDAVAAGFQDLKTGITDTVTWTKEAITWAQKHKALLAELAIVIGIVTAAITAYNIVHKLKIDLDLEETASISTVNKALWAHLAAMAASIAPYLAVAAAIAAVIAIIVICIKHWDDIKAKVTEVWESIKTKTSESVEKVKNKFAELKEKITAPIEAAKDKVKSTIDKIRSFFNFEWSLPKLKMPHVKITGSFSLMPPKVPKFSIDWYAKGGIVDSPTLFHYGNGRIGGMGEAGPEAIVPLNKQTLWPLAELLVTGIQGIIGAGNNSVLLDRLNAIEKAIYNTGDVYLDGMKVSKGLAKPSDEVSGQRQSLTDRGVLI